MLMRLNRFLVFLSLACPLTGVAAGPADIPHDEPGDIQFAPSTVRAFDHTGAFVTRETRPDGSVSAENNGSFQNVTVARVGPGGEIETYCTPSEEDARSWMARQDGGPGKSPLSKLSTEPDR